MGKLITVWSPVISTGVTTISIMLADRLSKKHKVCLVDFDLNNADVALYLNIKDMEHNIDNLFSYIEGDHLTDEVLDANLIKIKDMSFLQGTNQINKGPLFTVGQLEPILEKTIEQFEIVILNVNSNIDNAGTFLGLKNADEVIVVLEQNVLHYQKLIEKSKIIGSFLKDSICVVNKYNKNILLTIENISENISGKIIPLQEINRTFLLNQINMQTNYMNIFKNKKAKKYIENFDNLENVILVKLGFKKEEVKKKKMGIFGI